MTWEGDPDPPRPRGRLRTALVIIAAVAVAGLLVRSPSTTPDLVIEDSTPTPGPTATPTPIEGLRGLDALLAVREGRWEEVPVPAAATPAPSGTHPDDAPPDRQPAAAWNGDELIVLNGVMVHAHDPTTSAWRQLPDYPGSASAAKRFVHAGAGLLVIETDVETTVGAITSRTGWLLTPDDTWREIPTPPTVRLSTVVTDGGDLVAVGADARDPAIVGAPDRLWRLPAGADDWEDLPSTGLPVHQGAVHATVDGLLLLGFRLPSGPSMDGQTVPIEPVALMLEDNSTTWSPLLAPPGMVPGTQAAAIAPPDEPDGPPDRVVVLTLTDEAFRRTTYHFGDDAPRVEVMDEAIHTAAAGDLTGSPISVAWDGASTAWAQSLDDDPLLLAMDVGAMLPGAAIDLVVRPADEIRAFNRQIVPFPSGLFLTGGFVPGGATHEGGRIDRWIPAEAPPIPPVTSTPPGDSRTGGNLGLDQVLPLVEGVWRELMPPGQQTEPSVPRAFVWDGEHAVVAAGRDASAWDPTTNVWTQLPDLPLADAQNLQGVAADGTVIVAAATPVIPAPDAPGQSPAWALVNGEWNDVTSIPGEADLVGVVNGDILSARYPGAAPTPEAQLWLSDPAADAPQRLPDLPLAMTVTNVVSTPGGFVVIGSREVGGTGAVDDPFQFTSHAFQWDGQTWRELSIPDVDLTGAAVTWVPSTRAQDAPSDPAGGLLVVGPTAGNNQLVVTSLDLANGEVERLPIPLTEQLRRAGPIGDLAAVWDGADTVWVYGGLPTPLHLNISLISGQVQVAEPAGARSGMTLVWDGDGLLLLGGFDATGPVQTLSRWTATQVN